MNETTQKRIEAYQEEAEKLKETAPTCRCPRCSSSDPGYQVKEQRRRRIGLIEGSWVHWFSVVLLRWTCMACGGTLSWYPPFCQPYKRYVIDDMTRLSQTYLDDDAATYRSVTLGLGYNDGEQQLSPTTLWRWVGLLGRCERLAQSGLRLIQAKTPQLDLPRRIRPMVRRKYRSPERQSLLAHAQFFCLVAEVYSRIFSMAMIPNFGTGASL